MDSAQDSGRYEPKWKENLRLNHLSLSPPIQTYFTLHFFSLKILDFYIWTLVCFCRERRSREGESQRNFWRIFWWFFWRVFDEFLTNFLTIFFNSRLFFRERRSRERESQRNGRRVLGHGLNRDPSVPEGHPGIFPSSQTWVSARLAESHFNHPVSGSGPPCTNRTLPHLYGHRFADAHITRCRSRPSGQPFFHDYLITAQWAKLFI